MIKRLFYLLICSMLPLLSFGDDPAQALFAKGNELYAKGQYKAAADTYQQLLDEGYQSTAIYFNMGDASFKNDDIASALLYYEKARKLAPGDDDINFNIRFVNAKTTDKVDEAPEFFLTRWGRAFILNFSVSQLSVLSIVFVFLGSALLVLYFFAGSVMIKKSSFYISLSLGFLAIVTILIAQRQTSYFNEHRQAIIFTSSVNVKSGPVEKSNTLFVIHDGTKVNVLENDNAWMKIGLPNGNEGWVKTSDLKEI
jgi:tetratricopeptide (TPR) repeat protein